MTNFELKVVEMLDEEAVEILWKEAVREAKRSGEEDVFEYARNAFIDLLSDFVYEEVIGKVDNEEVRELLESAFDDVDKEDLANYIIVNKNYQI